MRMLQSLLFSTTLVFSISIYAAQKANLDSIYRLMNSKNYQAAVIKLKKLIKSYPNDADVWYQYSLALLKTGQADEAIIASKRSASFHGYRSYATFNLGVGYALKGQNNLALKTVNQAFSLGYLNFDRLKNEKALTYLREAGYFEFSPEQQYQSFTAHNGIDIPHKILLPENFDASKTYKGMIAFPSGNFGKASADWMINSLLNYKSNKDWIITVVTAPKKGLINHPAHHALNDLMKHVRNKYSIKNNKFHFLGYQSGGQPAITYSQMSQSYVLGITTIGNYSWDNWKEERLKEFNNMTVQLLVGENDTAGVEINQKAYKLLKSNNEMISLKVFDEESARIKSLEQGALFNYLR
ncbi:tetratricopeptide repeat protein [Pseudoalteromonas denitrificans]|uniref:Tetratricopeptide repeat-containing protein n=1 Tax=Pseudoalteromonas denitrificans DSM 6059 TaxID=1123010 RepID=A0A1I1K9Y3_9GAMM|nr:tetratricopeptide repeat protein [Pseudoalteromonas denitrificans]SFC57704.1 Tetratricopeptide repeat-containing protein [Pseudoalteromonas denitrificans DSM 6059]